jgi:hypothetical protein
MNGSALIALLAMATPAQQPGQETIRDADKVICKADKDTRSRITSAKVCKTKAEWAQDSRDDQDAVQDISEKSRLRF